MTAFKKRLGITLLCCVAVMALDNIVVLAQSGCPPVDHGMLTAWAGRGSTVYFAINGFPANIRPQVEAAFAKWTAANQSNGTNISFVPADANHPYSCRI
jgi:hypothetical protein